MNHLLREIAPIADLAWERIDQDAKDALQSTLAGRRLVDFKGPLGWDAPAIDLGTVETAETPLGPDVELRRRRTQPLVELRVPFEIPRTTLEAIGRGARHVGLDEVVEAARKIALAEDKLIFDGYSAGGVEGIRSASPHGTVTLEDDYERYPNAVAEALVMLRDAGVGGPYAIALGRRCYTGLATTTSGGYPVMQHVRRIVEGPLVWAPGVDGACVLSVRGGDHELVVGQDFSIGFHSATADAVRLYIEESVTFRNLEPAAGVAMRYRDAKSRGK